MPFDSSDGQGEYLINQWLRPFKPKFKKEAMDRYEKGFGQVKVRDPLDIFFPLAAPQNRRSPVNLPSYTNGTLPIMDEGSSDVVGYDTGAGNDSSTSTPPATTTAVSATGTPTSALTLSSSVASSTGTPNTTIVTGASGTAYTIVIEDTGGAGDLGCNNCKFGVQGDERIPCITFPGPCLAAWGGFGLCGYDGVFCPNAYGCGQGGLDCYCGGVNCEASPGVPCDPCGGSPPCPSAAVICCYADGTLIGTAPDCCACG